MGEIKVEGREATAITAIFNPELVFGQCGMRLKYRVGRSPYFLQAGLAPREVIWECGLFLHSSECSSHRRMEGEMRVREPSFPPLLPRFKSSGFR